MRVTKIVKIMPNVTEVFLLFKWTRFKRDLNCTRETLKDIYHNRFQISVGRKEDCVDSMLYTIITAQIL